MKGPGRASSRAAISVCGLLLVGVASSASAQSGRDADPAAPLVGKPPALTGPSLPAWALKDMPSAGSLFSLIETIPPDVIANRIDGGGMYAGTSAHIGAHGSSWTQTLFRVGDINITDPDGSGTPLALPGVLEWESVDVNTGIPGADVNTPGIVVNLTPRRPSTTWIRQVELSGAPPLLQAGREVTTPPAIARLNSYANGSVLLSGPIRDRLGVVFAGTYTRAARLERTNPTSLDGSIGSAFAHLVYAVSPRDEVRTVLWAQRSTTPVDHLLIFQRPGAQESATSLSAQATWERRGVAGAPSWRGYAALSARRRAAEDEPAPVLSIERLHDSPPWEQVYPGSGTDRSWQLGATMKPARFELFNRPHDTSVGIDLSGGSASQDGWFNGQIGELMNGVPARVWQFSSPGSASRWQQTTIAAYAADRVVLRPRLIGTMGLRIEHIGGSANGAANGVSWTNLLPRLGWRWALTEDGRLTWFTDYGRYGYQIRLRDLAYGDPSAATANVYKWNAPIGTTLPQAPAIGALVKRWGPGTGGKPDFSVLAPDVERPHMNEIVTGFEFHPSPAWMARVSGIARLDKGLLALTNRGVPFSAYTTSMVIDPGVDIAGGTTTQPLPIHNRPASTFGADQYLLTNGPEGQASFTGVDVAARAVTGRLVILAGGTAGRSEGWASSRGFHYDENDVTVLGEVFADPNASTYAKGRTFTERGYTLHLSGAYRFAHDIGLGVAARYQDGQHFSRMVVAPDLNQGPEMVRAFANGETRFTYVCTVDARLQKGFDVSGHRIDAIVDVFNLLNFRNEVEEVTVTGPTSRQVSAIQPPRALHVGARFGF
jgi:TonB dependent receptor-like, beta-barrel